MRNKNIYCALNEEKKTVFFISLNGRNYNLFTAPFKSDTGRNLLQKKILKE